MAGDQRRVCGRCGARLARDNPAALCSVCQRADAVGVAARLADLETEPVHAADLGAKIRRLRLGHAPALTQVELADRSGVSLSLIKKVENGDRVVGRLATLRLLAAALGVEVGELLASSSVVPEESAAGAGTDGPTGPVRGARGRSGAARDRSGVPVPARNRPEEPSGPPGPPGPPGPLVRSLRGMPRSAPAPIRLPEHVWHDPAVLALCREQDANGLFRLAKRHGVSNDRLGYWTGTDAAEASKRANGKLGRVTGLARWHRIAHGLNMPDHARLALGLAPEKITSPQPEPSTRDSAAAVPSTMDSKTVDSGTVSRDRRPNRVLRAIRETERRQSREEFAADLNRRARAMGENVSCDARLVARWEDGEVASPRPVYQRVLAAETGHDYLRLGFHPRSAAAPTELEAAERPVLESVSEMLARSALESESILAILPSVDDFDLLQEAVTQVGANYVSSPPLLMLKQSLAIRAELLRRMTTTPHSPSQLAKFYLAVGRASGVIAYAALDLGDSRSAAKHGAAVWRIANYADSDELRAWSRGTQSLIARYNEEYTRARLLAEDGLQYSSITGALRARLICAAAQCAANQGDAARALELINDAEKVRQLGDGDEETADGIFDFPYAKQKFYAASSLMWSSDQRSLRIAARSASEAIAIWRRPGSKRLLDDEALAHVYLATACMKLHEIDAGMEAIAPVFELQNERRTSWMRKRVAHLREILSDSRYQNSHSIAAAKDKLHEFETSRTTGTA